MKTTRKTSDVLKIDSTPTTTTKKTLTAILNLLKKKTHPQQSHSPKTQPKRPEPVPTTKGGLQLPLEHRETPETKMFWPVPKIKIQ
jgi:hypothetical protein